MGEVGLLLVTFCWRFIGDIRNSNSEYIAQHCTKLGFDVRNICTTSDDLQDISKAIMSYWNHHDIIFTIGGCGPTTDDITRDAIAKALSRPLEYHEPSWQHICARVSQYTNKPPAESNKQQAYFPQPCEVIINPLGTANGCFIQQKSSAITSSAHKATMLWMLPGPPRECLAMFKNHCLPTMQPYASTSFFQSWLTLGIGESQLTEILKSLNTPNSYQIGYRYDFPYVELKCYSRNKKVFDNVIHQIESLLLSNHIISKQNQWASQQLREVLRLRHNPDDLIHITDRVTHGLLQSLLSTPDTVNHIRFTENQTKDSYEISGLNHYWDKSISANEDMLTLSMNGTQLSSCHLPHYEERILIAASEWVCYWLLQLLK